MSEYQYYRFECLDGNLTAMQRSALRSISSRAEISNRAFRVHYNYSDLKADPVDLMRDYFDVGFYYANWGQLTVYIKLPPDTIPKEFSAIDCDFTASITHNRQYQLITLSSTKEGGYNYYEEENIGEYFDDLIPLRSELIEGDYRLLYLPWLERAYSGEKVSALPLIAFDFNELSYAQQTFLDLFGVPIEAVRALNLLLEVEPAHPPGGKTLSPTEWVDSLSEDNKRQLLCTLFEIGQLSRSQAVAIVNEKSSNRTQKFKYWLTSSGLDPYWQTAIEQIQEERDAAEAERIKQEAKERESHLNHVFASRSAVWSQAQNEADVGSGKSYNNAAKLLNELFDAYQLQAQQSEFAVIFERFIAHNAKRKALLKRVDRIMQTLNK